MSPGHCRCTRRCGATASWNGSVSCIGPASVKWFASVGEDGALLRLAKNPRSSKEHLATVVYDVESGNKYLLHSSASSHAVRVGVTFRPDRQVWHYEFDDLAIDVSLIMPSWPTRHSSSRCFLHRGRECFDTLLETTLFFIDILSFRLNRNPATESLTYC